MQYHVNAKGNAGVCKASDPSRCPFHNEWHFSSITEARESYESVSLAQEFYNEENIAPHFIPLSLEIEKVLNDLEKIGNPLIVGGSVRDSILGTVSKDIDIEVHKASFDELINGLKSMGYRVDEVGREFGILKVNGNGLTEDYDISVPRLENKTGKGHQAFEVNISKEITIRESCERRDFTFNSMLYDHSRKVLIDPFNGKEDLNNRVIRHVSDKFADDPLRVLRAMQFAGRFNMTITKETAELSQKLRKEYDALSSERIQVEWEKLFTKSKNLSAGLRVLQQSGWADTFPGLSEVLSSKNLDNIQKNKDILSLNPKILSPVMIARLMKNNKEAEIFIKGTVLGNDAQKEAISIYETNSDSLLNDYEIRKYAREARRGFTYENYHALSLIMNDTKGVEVAERAKELGIYTEQEKDIVQGRDILPHIDRKPGPWLGKTLEVIRDEQYKGSIKSQEEAIQKALEVSKNF